MNPICAKCIYLTGEAVRFRPCAKIPILHKDMLCKNEVNMIKDRVTGESYTPYCEEVNRHGECLEYVPVGLEAPSINFFEEDNLIGIYGSAPFVFTTDGTNPDSKMKAVGEYDDEQKVYVFEVNLEHSCTVKAACVIDGVLSDVVEKEVEIPDVPSIEFDKSTNTVTIKSCNKVYFTTNGSKVTEDSSVYEKPFVIDHNTTVKCRSYAREDFSVEVSRYCISIEPPVINFDSATNRVTIEADDEILYSVDGSDIYDDSAVYEEPLTLEKNTLVKAACIVDGELSETVEQECKVANPPVITYDEKTHKVTIESENPVRYTTDGTDPKKGSMEYAGPFTIKETCAVKAVSVTDVLSAVSELECIFVSPPEITFDTETNTVKITGENTILYSTDGSKIYDDSDEYTDPFVIDKNTTVKAACILNGILSDEVSLVCKVPSVPVITFATGTKTVTIKSDNPVLYTTDGSDVKKKDSEYKAPFKISATSTIKAKSIVGDRMSDQAELECVL